MDYFEELERMEKEYEKLKNKNPNKYNKKSLELENGIKDIKKNIIRLSSYKSNRMGEVMSDIVTEYEKKLFHFDCLCLGSPSCYNVYCIAPSNFDTFGVTYDKLKKSRDILILSHMTFYSTNVLGKLEGIDFKRFTYLEEFVKFVINYELNYGKIYNTKGLYDTYQQLEDEFLEIKKDEISNRKIERENKRKLILR